MTSVCALVVAVTLGAASAVSGQVQEFVRVAPAGDRFETRVAHKPFVPFGGVYFDPATYTDRPYPRFLVIGGFDETRTGGHFREIARLGANLVRISLSTGVMSPRFGELDGKACETLDRIIALARKHGLRVILDLMVDWEGRAEWMAASWEQYTDERTLQGLEAYYRLIAARYADEPAVLSYLVCDEARVPWSSNGLKAAWGEWVRKRYTDEDALKAAWPDYPRSGETWQGILCPDDENQPGSRRLYEYQRFREELAAEFARRLTAAIRSRDRNHLVSAGNLQWSAPLRVTSLKEDLLKPSSYPAFNPALIGPHLDYLHVNCYDWWDARVACFAEALGRYSRFPGKPVVLGEFSFDRKVVEQCAGVFSGFCAWAFFPLPSEASHHYLFDEKGKVTAHGQEFADVARKLASGKLALRYVLDGEAITISALDAWTDLRSAAKVYEDYLAKCGSGRHTGLRLTAPDFGCEGTRSKQ